MIHKLIKWSLKNRGLVIVIYLALAAAGYWALTRTPIDAIPDLSDNQVIVFTDWMGRVNCEAILNKLSRLVKMRFLCLACWAVLGLNFISREDARSAKKNQSYCLVECNFTLPNQLP